MRIIVPFMAALALFVIFSSTATAGTLKTYVSEFNVTNTPDSANLKRTLQEILSSRLNPEQVSLVEKPDQAEVLIDGSYALFGKMFSLDILIKNRTNGSLVKVFEQGQGQEDVIPALGRLAQKIDIELAKFPVSLPTSVTPAPTAAAPIMNLKETYVVREQAVQGNWSSAPIDGAFVSIALGRTRPSGERELFVAGEQSIRAYTKGKELKLIDETIIPASGKILALDSADLDKDGALEIYATIINREIASSRVYQFDGTSLKLIAKDLPWFFRGIGHDADSRIIYAQEIEKGAKYYGDVKVLLKSNNNFTTINPLKLPRSGNIFNFNCITDASGKENLVILNEDGYLVTFSPDGEELWKSSERFGGSESFFNSDVHASSRSNRDLNRWAFIEQRIITLKDGTLIVPRNEGSLRFGNIRVFNKYTLFALDWTGSVLKEKWHTRQSPGYLADYVLDENSKEVLLLEVVQKPGIFNKGKSVISVNRID